jgi:hypothetical protein
LSTARFAKGASLPEPEHLQVATLLLGKAAGDLAAAELLAQDQGQADHVVGLHAQQAVEKAIKAILASVEVEIPRTHDIVHSSSSRANSRDRPRGGRDHRVADALGQRVALRRASSGAGSSGICASRGCSGRLGAVGARAVAGIEGNLPGAWSRRGVRTRQGGIRAVNASTMRSGGFATPCHRLQLALRRHDLDESV